MRFTTVATGTYATTKVTRASRPLQAYGYAWRRANDRLFAKTTCSAFTLELEAEISDMVPKHVKIRSIRRGSRTGVATYAAAYRAGESIVDDRTGNLYKYAWRKDVVYNRIVLPKKFSGNTELNWARHRSTLWNRVEQAEHKKNSRVAREFIVLLPSELSVEQRVNLTHNFAQAIADRYQNAVDFAIHEPRLGRSENHHAHLLATTRELTPGGLGAKTGIEVVREPDKISYAAVHRQQYRKVHELWADYFDKALQEADITPRDSRSSFKDQIIDIETNFGKWAEYRRAMRAQGVDMKQIAREDGRATRLTASERELVSQRKREIRLKEKAELEQKQERYRENRRAKSEARTPEQVQEARRAKREAARARFRALPEEQKEEVRRRRRELHSARSLRKIAREAQRRHERYEENAETIKQKAREHYSRNQEAEVARARQRRKDESERRKAREPSGEHVSQSSVREQVQPAAVIQPARPPSAIEIRHQAVKNWLRMKQQEREQTPAAVQEKGPVRGRDDDFTR